MNDGSKTPMTLAQPVPLDPPGTAPGVGPDTPGGSPRPELLAPAGDWECARAAVENGADAIYFGLDRFNARMRARNFTVADLPALMEFLHQRGVKGYVTFNTLVFQNEIAEAEEFARALITAGVDAAIVQDVGICRLLRQLSPNFPIHISTQMTVTSAAGIEFARELGGNLVVLARECSLGELGKIQETLTRPGQARPALPLEVFVHGALCVAYSGQCLTSEALGGRSANRGECAQACRMPYELVADGRPVPLGDRKYLLSPQDLAGLDLLPQLARLGIASLKIEGRLKSPEYVANITRIYRHALDSLRESTTPTQLPDSASPRSRGLTVADELPRASTLSPSPPVEERGTGADRADPGSSANVRGSAPSPALAKLENETNEFRYEMEMAFSRGLHTGWFEGINNQQLVHARFGKKRGVYLGQVREVGRDSVSLELEGPLKPGDGVVFDAGLPEEKEEGGRVYEVFHRQSTGTGQRTVTLRFGAGDIAFHRVHVGDRIWKTSDPELERRLRRSFEGDAPRFQRPIFLEVHGFAGTPLTLLARDEIGHAVRLDSAMPLVTAEKQPLTTERLREQLGRLGGTPLKLTGLTNHLEGQVLLPVSELNRLRREMTAELLRRRAQPLRWTVENSLTSNLPTPGAAHQSAENPAQAKKPELIVLVRTLPQLDAALRSGIRTVYCDFENPKKYRDAVAAVRAFGSEGTPREVFVAPPRIFKMGEDWILKQVRSCEADGYLVRNYDHLQFFVDSRRIGDYSLNIANRLSAEYFMTHFGLERVTASYDLNFTQLDALLQAAPPDWFEITIHQHMPMFHMEHCVFCAFLTSGTDYTNCGRPCDTRDLKVRDRVGAEHPVKADVGCRNTVFNALAQTGSEYVARMLNLGVRRFRLEFLNETPNEAASIIAKYQALLRGEMNGAQLWRELKLFHQLGVTRGQIAGSAIKS
jgi:U32 family peptidase